MWRIQINRLHLLTEDGRKFVADRIPEKEVNNIRTFNKREFREVLAQTGLLKNRPFVGIV
jgi:hypothetical protein